jgi:uncharacterized protein
MRKRLLLGASAGLAGFALLAASAQAHVSFHPNVLPAGANATLDIRVPNEMDNANTNKLVAQVPPGFTDISTEPIPGWTAQTQTRKLAQPVQTDDGPVSEEVSQITWTASGNGGIPPDGFQNFPISTAIPDQAGKVLTFKVLQSYDNGQVVRWIGPESSDNPAPTIDVTDANGVIQDVAGTEAGPPAIDKLPSLSGSSSSSDGASKGLGIAALVIAILGLAAGAAALIRTGRRPAG